MDTRGAQRAGAPWTSPIPRRRNRRHRFRWRALGVKRYTMITNRSGSEPIAASGRTLVRAAAVPATSRRRLFDAAAVPIVGLLVKLLQGIDDVIKRDDEIEARDTPEHRH